jgi:hypothetical protein
MNLLPCPAQFVHVVRQDAEDVPDVTPRKSVVLPEIRRSGWAVQMEDRLATTPGRVDVGRSMIVRIDHNPQPVKSENRRHKVILAEFLSAWVGKQVAYTLRVSHAGEGDVGAANAGGKTTGATPVSRNAYGA